MKPEPKIEKCDPKPAPIPTREGLGVVVSTPPPEKK